MSFCRTDATAVADVPDGWQIHLAAAGVLSVWDGSPLRSEDHHNNLWVRPGSDEAWALDLTISDGNNGRWIYRRWIYRRWIYRRQPAISGPWAEVVLRERTTGVPYLAPEIQPLLKSVHLRPIDHIDAAQVIPALATDRAAWLQAVLPHYHLWQQIFLSQAR